MFRLNSKSSQVRMDKSITILCGIYKIDIWYIEVFFSEYSCNLNKQVQHFNRIFQRKLPSFLAPILIYVVKIYIYWLANHKRLSIDARFKFAQSRCLSSLKLFRWRQRLVDVLQWTSWNKKSRFHENRSENTQLN